MGNKWNKAQIQFQNQLVYSTVCCFQTFKPKCQTWFDILETEEFFCQSNKCHNQWLHNYWKIYIYNYFEKTTNKYEKAIKLTQVTNE